MQPRIPSILDSPAHDCSSSVDRLFFKEISKITNTGPILDFTLSDMDTKSSCTSSSKQIIACCGAFTESRLKLIRSDLSTQVSLGALFNDWTSVLFEKIWQFPQHSLCVLSTHFQTVFLNQTGDSFKDISRSFSDVNSPSLLVSPLNNNRDIYIRVTPTRVIIFKVGMNTEGVDNTGDIHIDDLASSSAFLSYNPLIEVSFCSLLYDVLVCVFIDSCKGQSIFCFYKISPDYSLINIQEIPVSGQVFAFSVLATKNLMSLSPHSGILVYSTWEFPSDFVVAAIKEEQSTKLIEICRYTLSDQGNNVIQRSGCSGQNGAYEMPLLISSLQLASFVNASSDTPYAIFLNIGTGDGQLFVFSVSLALSSDVQEISILFEKKIGLGNKPVQFSSVTTGNMPTTFLFAWGDFSVILFCSSSILRHVFLSSVSSPGTVEFNTISLFSNTNVDVFCRPSMMAISKVGLQSDHVLLMFSFDEIVTQHMQIKSFPLISSKSWEMPIRICYCELSNIYAVITLSFEGRCLSNSKNGHSYLRLFDASSMRVLNSYPFLDGVQATCLDVVDSFLIVGCSISPKDGLLPQNGEDASSFFEGSIFVFNVHAQMASCSLSPIFEHKIPNNSKGDGGPLYSLAHYKKFIFAGVQAQILAFRFDNCTMPQRLVPAGQKYAQILPMYLTVSDNELIVGDVMKSISISRIAVCSEEKSKYEGEFLMFEELGKEYATRWMTSQAVFSCCDSKTYVGCDGEGVLFFLERPANASNIVDEKALKKVASFYIGDTVNQFRRGSISLQSSLDKESDFGLFILIDR